MAATHEFIDTLATSAVTLPYVVKSRFGFAAAHLCHQANILKDPKHWVDDLPLDGDIFPHTADKYGKLWKGYKKLKKAQDRIGAKDFQDATRNFRNTYNHRFSPRFVIGMTQMVTRHVDKATGRVCYGFGGCDPLDLVLVTTQLEREQQLFYAAFEAFQEMVREHESAIAAQQATT
jgi:hypothetical protein